MQSSVHVCRSFAPGVCGYQGSVEVRDLKIKMVQDLYVAYTYPCLLNNLSRTYNAKHSKCYIVVILVCAGNNAKRKLALQIFI